MTDSHKNVFYLETLAHIFIPMKTHDNKIYPSLGIWVSSFPTSPLIPQDEEHENFPLYFISDIHQSAFNKNSSVTVTLKVGHDDFGDETTEDDNYDVYSTEIKFDLPVQMLSIVQALCLVPEDFNIFFYEGHPPADATTNTVSDYTGVKLVASFPPVNFSETNDALSESLSSIVTPSYTNSLFPVSYDTMSKAQNGEDTVQNYIRQAQGMLLGLTSGIAHGDVTSFTTLLKLAEWLESIQTMDESESQEKTLASVVTGEHFFKGTPEKTLAFAKSFIEMSRKTYLRTVPVEILERENASLEHEALEASEDFSFLDEFDSIIESLDLSEVDIDKEESLNTYVFHNDTDEKIKEMADPFKDGFPHPMKSLESYFEKGGPAAEIKELLRWDWTRPENMTKGINTHSYSSVLVSQILVAAARSIKLKDVTGHTGVTVSPAFNLVRWISLDEDQTMWELPALTPYLMNYDFDAFIELLSTNPTKDVPHYRPYLMLVLHQFGHVLYDEEWDLSNMDERLSTLDINPPIMPKIRSFLVNYIHSIKESIEEGGFVEPELEDDDQDSDDEDGDENCAFGMSTMKLLQSSADIDLLTQNIAWLIPLFADMATIDQGIQAGDELWNTKRQEYIKDFLTEIANNTRRGF